MPRLRWDRQGPQVDVVGATDIRATKKKLTPWWKPFKGIYLLEKIAVRFAEKLHCWVEIVVRRCWPTTIQWISRWGSKKPTACHRYRPAASTILTTVSTYTCSYHGVHGTPDYHMWSGAWNYPDRTFILKHHQRSANKLPSPTHQSPPLKILQADIVAYNFTVDQVRLAGRAIVARSRLEECPALCRARCNLISRFQQFSHLGRI